MSSAHRRLAMISKQLAPALENKMMPMVAPVPTKASAAKKPVKVVVTGAAGNIAYSIIFMIGQGVMLGPDQPIELRLLDIPAMVPKLKGVEMELQDCAFPLLTSITSTADYKTAFQGVQIALLIGAKPRGPNMERKDLLFENAKIFSGQGKALNDFADRNVKVLVVGNPANTNALICMTNAPNIPKENFSALTRLDQNRAVSQIAGRAGVPVNAVSNVIIWGNHSKTQYPDVNHAIIVQGGAKKPVKDLIKDHAWLTGAFLTTVQDRGGEVIKARGSSSAASAANAVVDHIRNWVYGTKDGEYVSMAVRSDGSYGVPEGLIYSFPVVCKAGSYKIVKGLSIDKFSREKMDLTTKELLEEKKLALDS